MTDPINLKVAGNPVTKWEWEIRAKELEATIAQERQQHAEASEKHAAEYHRIATAMKCHVHDDMAVKAEGLRKAALEDAAETCDFIASTYNIEEGRWERAAASRCARYIRLMKETPWEG